LRFAEVSAVATAISDHAVAVSPAIRPLSAALACVLVCGGCGADRGTHVDAGVDSAAPMFGDASLDGTSDSFDPLARSGERYWLTELGGRGPLSVRICQSGRDDQVTRALCRSDAQIDGLKALYRALDLDHATDGVEQNLAIGTNSSGLSFKTVSVLNPRLFLVTPQDFTFPKERAVAAAFSRGEQLVEMVAVDRRDLALNFYLLSYDLPCSPKCSAEQLLSAASESAWPSWTVFTEHELEDTPFDCLSCHRPDGPGTPNRLLMRDFPLPWFHWMPTELISNSCEAADGGSRPPQATDPNLRSTFEHVHPEGYAGVSFDQTRNSSGHNLHTFVAEFSSPQEDPSRGEPFVMDSKKVLDEWRCLGRTDTWQTYRAQTLASTGVPIPFFQFDVLDAAKAAPALSDLSRYLHELPAEISVASALENLVSADAKVAVGALIEDDPDGAVLLRSACIRCHDRRAPSNSHRSAFQVETVTPGSAARAVERLQLPPDSPFVMPPVRASSLTPQARSRLLAFLRSRAP
jgi:hypothetical protein